MCVIRLLVFVERGSITCNYQISSKSFHIQALYSSDINIQVILYVLKCDEDLKKVSSHSHNPPPPPSIDYLILRTFSRITCILGSQATLHCS